MASTACTCRGEACLALPPLSVGECGGGGQGGCGGGEGGERGAGLGRRLGAFLGMPKFFTTTVGGPGERLYDRGVISTSAQISRRIRSHMDQIVAELRGASSAVENDGLT